MIKYSVELQYVKVQTTICDGCGTVDGPFKVYRKCNHLFEIDVIGHSCSKCFDIVRKKVIDTFNLKCAEYANRLSREINE